MKVGSLFSGIGGFDLGFENQGYDISWCVEKEDKCREVLKKHFTKTKIFSDILTTDETTLSPVDVIVGGFPCQDLSIAGFREGLSGERSSLFYEFKRFIRRTTPRFVVVENVPGLLSSHSGRDFALVLHEMVKGWGAESVAWRILDSRFFGVPQRRRRVFIVADLGGECASEILNLPESSGGNPAKGKQAGKGITCTPEGIAGTCSCKWAKGTGGPAGDEHYNLIAYRWQNNKDGIVPDQSTGTLRASMGGSGFSEINHPLLQDGSVVRRLTPLECERLQGFPDYWTGGQSDSTRYKQIGNAVTVNVSEWIASRIKNFLQ